MGHWQTEFVCGAIFVQQMNALSFLQNYDTTESKLRREFEVYGPIKRVSVSLGPWSRFCFPFIPLCSLTPVVFHPLDIHCLQQGNGEAARLRLHRVWTRERHALWVLSDSSKSPPSCPRHVMVGEKVSKNVIRLKVVLKLCTRYFLPQSGVIDNRFWCCRNGSTCIHAVF